MTPTLIMNYRRFKIQGKRQKHSACEREDMLKVMNNRRYRERDRNTVREREGRRRERERDR